MIEICDNETRLSDRGRDDKSIE